MDINIDQSDDDNNEELELYVVLHVVMQELYLLLTLVYVVFQVVVERYTTESTPKYLRNKLFSYYDSWIQIFGKDKATDEGEKIPTTMAEDPLNNEDVLGEYYIPVMDFQTMGPFAASAESHELPLETFAKSKSKKRPRVRDDVATSLTVLADKIGELISVTNDKLEFIGKRMGYAHDLALKRATLNEDLRKLPLPVDERLDVCELISHDTQKLDMFFSLNNDEKLRWVMKLLNRMGK